MSIDAEKKKFAFPKLENLLYESIKKISKECGTLIGKKVAAENSKIDITNIEGYLSSNDANYMLVTAEVEEGYKGQMYMLFPLKDAVVLGGLLLAMDEQQIKEKTKEETLDDEYTDAFMEFGSQVCGMLDGVFRNHLRKSVHVKQSQNTLFNLQKAGEFPTELLKGECVALYSDMTVTGFDRGKLSMFIPKDLGEALYEETIEIYDEGREKDYIGTVLVVNPVLSETKTMKRSLDKGQYKVLIAKDGVSTITTLQKEKVDIILMDMELPKEKGVSICEKIRRNLLTEEIPIIMCSSSPTQQQVVDSIKAGAQDFIVKPCDEDKLLDKIKRNMLRKPAMSVLN